MQGCGQQGGNKTGIMIWGSTSIIHSLRLPCSVLIFSGTDLHTGAVQCCFLLGNHRHRISFRIVRVSFGDWEAVHTWNKAWLSHGALSTFGGKQFCIMAGAFWVTNFSCIAQGLRLLHDGMWACIACIYGSKVPTLASDCTFNPKSVTTGMGFNSAPIAFLIVNPHCFPRSSPAPLPLTHKWRWFHTSQNMWKGLDSTNPLSMMRSTSGACDQFHFPATSSREIS